MLGCSPKQHSTPARRPRPPSRTTSCAHTVTRRHPSRGTSMPESAGEGAGEEELLAACKPSGRKEGDTSTPSSSRLEQAS
eukprot:755517-Hanusia_phi.AAC.3